VAVVVAPPHAPIRTNTASRILRWSSKPWGRATVGGSPTPVCGSLPSLRYLHPDHDEQLELSTDDVFLNPGYFDGGSRLDTDLSPPDFPGGSHPIVSAN